MNHVYPCDLDLLQYLAKKDIPVKKGETYSWELVQSENKWIAKKVGPAPEEFTGFKTGKDILKENLNSMKSTTCTSRSNRSESPGDGRDNGRVQRTHGTESKGETRAGESRC